MTAILDREQIRKIAPSVFATQPYEAMSHRYRFIGTGHVLDIMEGLGFHPVKAQQSRSRIEGKAAFTRHAVRLRQAEYLDIDAVGEEVPEIVLENSHDGSSAYRLHAGIWRKVCSNGLTISSATFGTISVKHSGGRDFETRIADATKQIADYMPRAFETVAEWKQIELTRPMQLALAEEAMALKPNPSIKYSALLTARRPEDYTDQKGNRDLWKTLNSIEENIIRGGLAGMNQRGRRIRTRPVRSVAADIGIHRGLWRLAEQVAEMN